MDVDGNGPVGIVTEFSNGREGSCIMKEDILSFERVRREGERKFG